jgi:ribulose-phosphate 3-epimerase
MIEILPAILAKSEEEFMAKIDKVRPLGATLHIDVMDGVFVPHVTWAPIDRVREIVDGTPFEAHLMVSNPEHAVPTWIAAGATRVIFHAESTPRDPMICRALAERCPDVSIALNPDTPVSRITEDLHVYDKVTVMGVPPGKSGQPFQEIALEKIAMLKRLKPSLRITVDGGAKPENIAALVAAGADFIVVGSALTDAEDPGEAYFDLKRAAGLA